MSFRIRVAAIASAMAVAVIDTGYVLSAGAAKPASDKIKAIIQKALDPSVKIKNVTKPLLAGLYEISPGSQVVYSNTTNRCVLNGDLLGIQTAANLIQRRLTGLNHVKWSDLSLDCAVKWVKGNGARKITVFSDPNCPYYHKLEQMLTQIDDITVCTFLFPVLSEGSNTRAKQIWCSADRAKAWHDWITAKTTPGDTGTCDTPLETNLKLGQQLSVTDTSAIIFPDGPWAPGLIDAATLGRRFATLEKS